MLKTNQNIVESYPKHHEQYFKERNIEEKGTLNELYTSIKLNNLPSKYDHN